MNMIYERKPRGRWDKYRSFEELSKWEIEGWDYVINQREGESGIAIVAIHGGGIEPGTTSLADAIAGENHSFYSFCGKDWDHHITSHLFDESNAVQLVEQSDCVVSVHRMMVEEKPLVSVSGLYEELRIEMSKELQKAGFVIQETQKRRYAGEHSNNICNRGACGGGVQLELSNGLMCQFYKDPEYEEYFVFVIRNVLKFFRSQSTDT